MRKRMIDCGIWEDEHFGSLSDKAKILFIACITNADDEGRLSGNPSHLKAIAFRYDESMTKKKVIDLLEECQKTLHHFKLYKVEDCDYIWLERWEDYQHIRKDRFIKSKLPAYTNGIPNDNQMTTNGMHRLDKVRLDKIKLDKINIDTSCSEPQVAAEPEDPIILIYPCKGMGKKEWILKESKLKQYKESFPAIDVLQHCKNARQWCIDNPKRQKTYNGMPGYLSRWLTKEQNLGGKIFDKKPANHIAPEEGKYDRFK